MWKRIYSVERTGWLEILFSIIKEKHFRKMPVLQKISYSVLHTPLPEKEANLTFLKFSKPSF